MGEMKQEHNRTLIDLVEEHYEKVFRYAFRLTGSSADAEDITQQAFLQAQSRIDQLRDVKAAMGWLFTITRNAFLKSIRDNKETAVSIDSLAEPAQEADLELDFNSEELQAAINELPEEFRTPLILFYFREFSYKDIASQLDVPMGTVMSRLARAKSVLRRRLTPNHSSVKR